MFGELSRQGGPSGGIIMTWRKDMVEPLSFRMGSYWITAHLKSIENQFDWVHTGVYVPGVDAGKTRHLEEIGRLIL